MDRLICDRRIIIIVQMNFPVFVYPIEIFIGSATNITIITTSDMRLRTVLGHLSSVAELFDGNAPVLHKRQLPPGLEMHSPVRGRPQRTLPACGMVRQTKGGCAEK